MISNLRIGTNEGMPVKISEGDRYKHIAVFGKPGAGKTALLSNFWKQDSLFKTAKILIDPSGSFAKEAYAMSGGYYCSIDNPIGINPLEDPYAPDDIADNFIEVLNQVVSMSTENVPLTVRMRSALREAIVWCVEHNQRRLDAVVDYLKTRCKQHAETRTSIIDRLNLFIQDKRLRRILCEENPISWEQIIEGRKTFILDCHNISEDKMIFLGTLVTHGIKSYLRFSRKKDYKPLALYVDECHNFINPNYFTILKEGRKYKVSAILATQDFASMPEKLTRVILSNVGTLISFGVGNREAGQISKEFLDKGASEIQFPEKFHCSYRTPKDEGTAKTYPPPFVRVKKIKKNFEVKEQGLKWFTIEGSCR